MRFAESDLEWNYARLSSTNDIFIPAETYSLEELLFAFVYGRLGSRGQLGDGRTGTTGKCDSGTSQRTTKESTGERRSRDPTETGHAPKVISI